MIVLMSKIRSHNAYVWDCALYHMCIVLLLSRIVMLSILDMRAVLVIPERSSCAARQTVFSFAGYSVNRPFR